MLWIQLLLGILLLPGCALEGASGGASGSGRTDHWDGVSRSEPLVMGETFVLASGALGEERRVNVFAPTVYGESIDGPMPVLYVLDGGRDEDFLHIAGLVQILVSNGGMRPFLVVGIENTSRRRDMTGPTSNAEDREIAPVVGGSGVFRRFIRDELMAAVGERYDTTGEAAVVGESLAGLFVVETLVLEPDLFDTYIAVDPSLWWNGGAMLRAAGDRTGEMGGASVFLASSDEPELAELTARLAGALRDGGVACTYVPHPGETHATVFHPAALAAFRAVLGGE